MDDKIDDIDTNVDNVSSKVNDVLNKIEKVEERLEEIGKDVPAFHHKTDEYGTKVDKHLPMFLNLVKILGSDVQNL